MKPENTPMLEPRLIVHENSSKGTAAIAGFDFEEVQKNAFIFLTKGYVPVDERYDLMEHRVTGIQGHFRKITMIKQIIT